MIAVTGASGLLGGVMVDYLRTRGLPVIAIIRQTSQDTHCRSATLDDPASLVEAFQGIETVVHSAGLVSFNPRQKKQLYQTNVEGTANVVNAALQAGVKRLIHISSVAALPRPTDGNSVNESAKALDSKTDFPSYYGFTKHRAEIEVFRGGEEGLQIAIVNPSVVLAPSATLRSSARIFEYVLKEKWFYTNAWLNYVDARDVAEAIVAMNHRFPNGERFILNGGTVPYIDFFCETARQLGKRGPVIRVNQQLIWLAAALEEFRSFVLQKEPIITRSMANSLRKKVQYGASKSVDLLNMTYRQLQDTVNWCCGFYRENVNPNY
jgi:dihydroflavonol-4-reductase